MAVYRVFVTRHYIDVIFFDIVTTDEKKARSLAKQAAKKFVPDSRLVATDNNWHSDEPTKIERVGFSSASMSMKPIMNNKKGEVFLNDHEIKRRGITPLDD